MSEDTDICGYPTADGSPCQHPTTDDGDPDRCWIGAHNDAPTESDDPGRPRALADERTQQRVLVAVGQGLKVRDQAALAGVSPDTLRRALCCIETPRNPVLESDPCEFCENYAQAHANGAREVLNDCRPEFVASASYGYVEKQEREIHGEGGGPVDVTVKREVVTDGDGD